MKRLTTGAFFALPHAIVILLLVANTIAFVWCFHTSGTAAIPTSVLVGNGALIPAALQPNGYWRLVAAGFLHGDPAHLLANLASLMICGPFLERRLGSSTFVLVYALALIGASITSILLHPGPFVGIGASGAIFGILGALFALWTLGASELSPAFFLVNFSLNAAAAAREPNIDWAAHLGGFVVGVACIAVLDLVARANARWLRCKFPEFVKMNTLLLGGFSGAWLWLHPLSLAAGSDPRRTVLAVWVAGLPLGIKLLDLLLSARHGLATVVCLFALCNGVVIYLLCDLLRPGLVLQCRLITDFGGDLGGAAGVLCPNAAAAPLAIAVLAGVLTLAVLTKPFRRGWRDVGFVSATFMGDRQRERGLVRPIQHTRA